MYWTRAVAPLLLLLLGLWWPVGGFAQTDIDPPAPVAPATITRTPDGRATIRAVVQMERLAVGSRFNPGVGCVRRSGVEKHYGLFKFTPRTTRFTSIRKFQYIGSLSHIDNTVAKRTDTREVDAEFGIEFQNSDRFFAGYASTHEYLPQPFRIANGVTLYGIGRLGYLGAPSLQTRAIIVKVNRSMRF